MFLQLFPPDNFVTYYHLGYFILFSSVCRLRLELLLPLRLVLLPGAWGVAASGEYVCVSINLVCSLEWVAASGFSIYVSIDSLTCSLELDDLHGLESSC